MYGALSSNPVLPIKRNQPNKNKIMWLFNLALIPVAFSFSDLTPPGQLFETTFVFAFFFLTLRSFYIYVLFFSHSSHEGGSKNSAVWKDERFSQESHLTPGF
jgi:hypothetical protein